MPAQDFKRKPLPFVQRGFSLARPAELLPPELLALCVNARYYTLPGGGEWRQRPGTAAYGGMAAVDQLSTHSARRVNNPTPGAAFAYWHGLGAGSKLYVENAAHNAFASLITGLSGSPLALIPVRPYSSPFPWLYAADANLWRKVGEVGGALVAHQWGVAPPLAPPALALGSPVYKVISDFDAVTETAVAWVGAGVATNPPTVATRLNQVITYIKYDSGSTGWASIVPDAFPVDLQAGMRLVVNSGGGSQEAVRVEEVYEQIASTTIQSITFDAGATGACVIQPAVAVKGIRRDMLLRLAGGTAENVRVLSVTEGPDGVTSFRCVTVNTHAAAEAVDGLRSFRTHLAGSHAAAETLTASCFSDALTGAGTGTLTHAVARDLSTTGAAALGGDDVMHFSLQLSDPSSLEEGRILFDVNPSGSSHNFDENALFCVFRASDLQPAIAGGQTFITAQRTALARQLTEQRVGRRYYGGATREFYGGESINISVDEDFFAGLPYDPELDYTPESPTLDPGSPQTPTGASQWYELRVRLGDLIRIGSDRSRTLRDVAAVRVQVKVTAACTLKVDSAWVGGTSGPDSAPDDFTTLPYYYAYRYRSSTTGAKSNFSPPTRSGVMPLRNSVVVATAASADAQVDLVDIIRAGGALSDWRLVATVADGASFTDALPDSALLGAKAFQLTSDFQPFPSIDLPRAGTCNVSGTTVSWAGGDTFNTSWSRNSKIIIDGTEYSLYSSPSSTTKLELNQSAGTKTGAAFYLDGATLLGQPLPVAWGPAGGGMYGDVIFACGDARQAGSLFFTSAGDPDSTLDTNSLEITSASEPLMNGCVYRGRAFVFSSGGLFEILPRFGYGYQVIENLGTPFLAERVSGVRGLHARWAMCVGDLIYFLASDGIYATNGAEMKCLTDELAQLFPHDGVAGESVTRYGVTVFAPDLTQTSALRLAWHENRLYFDHLDTGGNRRTLVFNTAGGAPESYDYYPQGVTFHRAEETEGGHALLLGGADGKLYTQAGTADPASAAIPSVWGTAFENFGDPRAVKLFGDLFVESYGNNSDTLVVTPYFDEGDVALTASNLIPSGRSESVIDLNSGEGRLARSAGLKLAVTSAAGAIRLFSWEPSALFKGEETALRGTDWDDGGYGGRKFVQGVRLECDTLNLVRTVKVQADGDDTGIILQVQHDGQLKRAYPNSEAGSQLWVPFRAYLMRLVPTDSDAWRDVRVEWVFEPEPDLATTWRTQPTAHGAGEFQLLQSVSLMHLSTEDFTFEVYADGALKHTATIANGAGGVARVDVLLPSIKGRLFEYRFGGAEPFALYREGCIAYLKRWGGEGPFQPAHLFGGPSFQKGAEI